MISVADVLICLKINGFVSIEDLAEQFACSPNDVSIIVGSLVSSGKAKAMPAGIKLREEGRAAAQEAWEAERSQADAAEMTQIAQRFARLDSSFVKAISDWRMRKTADGPVRNDHEDTLYDARLIGSVQQTHLDVLPIAIALGEQVERCATYALRLEHALAKLEAGDTRFMSDTVVESYNTVWTELREDVRFLSAAE